MTRLPILGTLNVDTNTFTSNPQEAHCETFDGAEFIEPSPMGRGVYYAPLTGCGLVYCSTIFYYWTRWMAHEQFRSYSFWLGAEGDLKDGN